MQVLPLKQGTFNSFRSLQHMVYVYITILWSDKGEKYKYHIKTLKMATFPFPFRIYECVDGQ